MVNELYSAAHKSTLAMHSFVSSLFLQFLSCVVCITPTLMSVYSMIVIRVCLQCVSLDGKRLHISLQAKREWVWIRVQLFIALINLRHELKRNRKEEEDDEKNDLLPIFFSHTQTKHFYFYRQPSHLIKYIRTSVCACVWSTVDALMNGTAKTKLWLHTVHKTLHTMCALCSVHALKWSAQCTTIEIALFFFLAHKI